MTSIFSNPLATASQLATSPSSQDGIPETLERQLRLAGIQLIQAAGILMELPQPTIATAIVLFQRFYLVASMRQWSVKDTGQAVLFLSCKLTEFPQRPRDIINVYAYLVRPSSPSPFISRPSTSTSTSTSFPSNDTIFSTSAFFHVNESTYISERKTLLTIETQILKHLSFQTHVALPYTLSFNYLKSLGVLNNSNDASSASKKEKGGKGSEGGGAGILETTFAYLNTFLYSPACVYITHQPHELAVAAIYLAARDVGGERKLPEGWWEVWDVERETLGFLVVVGRCGIQEKVVIGVQEGEVPVDSSGLEIRLMQLKGLIQ